MKIIVSDSKVNRLVAIHIMGIDPWDFRPTLDYQDMKKVMSKMRESGWRWCLTDYIDTDTTCIELEHTEDPHKRWEEDVKYEDIFLGMCVCALAVKGHWKMVSE